MSSVTIFGHGYVGDAIAREFKSQGITVYRSHHTELRTATIGTLGIVNAAGYTGKPNVDSCETERPECMDGNVMWPLRLHQYWRGFPVVHVGSGCIYSGDQGFTESDPPNFHGSFYSLCKLMSERSLAEFLVDSSSAWPTPPGSYVLRVRIPFGSEDHPKNYLTKLRTYPKLVDFKNSISCLDDVARAVVHFAVNKPEAGVYNVVNPGSVTTRMVAEMLGLEKEWFVSEEEFGTAVKAPRSNCTLSSDKLARVFPIRHVIPALEECIKNLRSTNG